MPDIHIRREHQLGLPAARRLVRQWAAEAAEKLGLRCSVNDGENDATVTFSRSGVKGRLVAAADHVELRAELGILLGAFKPTIEHEIEKNLDALLVSRPGARQRGA